MTTPVVHDITIVRRQHWSLPFGYYNPLANALADMSSPVNITGWTFEWTLTDNSDPAAAVVVVTLTLLNGITVTGPGGVIVALDSAATAALPLMIGEHALRAVTTLAGYDEILVVGRALVTDGY